MKNLIVIIAVFTVYTINAQETPIAPNQETQKKIDVFSDYYARQKASGATKENKDEGVYRWAFKTDPVAMFATGEFPLIFEYKLLENLSVEASAGITYPFKYQYEEYEDDLKKTPFTVKPSLGASFRASVKYYPFDDDYAIEGMYLGIQVFDKLYNNKYDVESNSLYSDYAADLENESYSANRLGVSLIFGRQKFSLSNFLTEIYIGIGYGNTTYNTAYPETREENGVKTEVLVLKTQNFAAPFLQFGYRVGFGN